MNMYRWTAVCLPRSTLNLFLSLVAYICLFVLCYVFWLQKKEELEKIVDDIDDPTAYRWAYRNDRYQYEKDSVLLALFFSSFYFS